MDIMMPEPNLQRYLPHIKQQMLRELLTNKTYGLKEWMQLAQLLNVNGLKSTIRLMLIYPESGAEPEDIFALTNIAHDILEQEGVLSLSTLIGDTLVILVDNCSSECMVRSVEMIKHYYMNYYRLTFLSWLTDAEDITNVRRLYKEARHNLRLLIDREAKWLIGRERPRLSGTNAFLQQVYPDKFPPSDIVTRMIRYVEEHLSDPTLSLLKLSKEVFYMNSDYLGKLFRKHTGEKFSHYVMRMRMTKAAQYMAHYEESKILDIAAMVGFSHNVQYFSQVFKKMSGYSPTEYRNKLRRQAQ